MCAATLHCVAVGAHTSNRMWSKHSLYLYLFFLLCAVLGRFWLHSEIGTQFGCMRCVVQLSVSSFNSFSVVAFDGRRKMVFVSCGDRRAFSNPLSPLQFPVLSANRTFIIPPNGIVPGCAQALSGQTDGRPMCIPKNRNVEWHWHWHTFVYVCAIRVCAVHVLRRTVGHKTTISIAISYKWARGMLWIFGNRVETIWYTH